MTARIDRLWPDPAEHLPDDELVTGLLHPRDVVRVNFVASVDGAATRDGRSGGLSGAADERYFELLRRTADVVLVGAGTVRTEGYSDLRVGPPSARWRHEHGMPEHPELAIASSSLDLDPSSRVFVNAPTRPVLLTGRDARHASTFSSVADVVEAGANEVDGALAVAALRARGHRRILCEGGPSFFGTLLAADVVDELFLTVSPSIEGGDAPRIVDGELPAPRGMRLAHVLRAGDTLLLRWTRG